MKAELPHILVVDDDNRLRALIGKYLREHGFVVVSADSAEEAREALKYMLFDLAILDVMMPHETGHEFLQKLRSTSQLPVLMLTALGDSADRITGLEFGADDYMAKPFEPKELLLRIEAILRRSSNVRNKNEVKFGEYSFNNEKLSLKKNGVEMHLTTNELGLLKILTETGSKPISREDLAAKIGGINERAVDVQIMRLRKKIENDPKRAVYIQTVRGEGYKLNVS
ncbi:MAG: DNA-binding response regulator [Alphaproteobacteria bacterium CG11_big_fil_rev_8_21_14_0_20_44_7]|nr:MAG: DNA-binding response regulator [Alphaproteobacteria bacterium CG11_big_fil_rev_8_21_14_0_20_44_7]